MADPTYIIGTPDMVSGGIFRVPAPAGNGTISIRRVATNGVLASAAKVFGYTAAPAPSSGAYALSTTRAQPSFSSLTFEQASLVVRESAGYTGAGPFIIENRNFQAQGNDWAADIYMPNGQEVILRNCSFASQSASDFIHATDGTRITVDKCRFYAFGNQPIGQQRGRAFYGYNLRKLVFTNNYLLNTAGGKAEFWTSGGPDTDTVTWKNNRYDNICGGTGGDYRQALQLQHINSRPGIEVAYNQVINTPGASRVEDNFNLGESSGTAASPLRIHHNYVRGAYPANPTDGGFTGTGMTTDAGGAGVDATLMPSYILAEYNWFVACMNACMNIAAGHHITYQNNKMVVSGKLANGAQLNGVNNAVAIFKGQGYSDAQFDYNRIINNDIRVNQGNGENPYYPNSDVGPNSQALLANNTLNTYTLNATYADEEATFSDWQNYLTAQQIQVGIPA